MFLILRSLRTKSHFDPYLYAFLCLTHRHNTIIKYMICDQPKSSCEMEITLQKKDEIGLLGFDVKVLPRLLFCETAFIKDQTSNITVLPRLLLNHEDKERDRKHVLGFFLKSYSQSPKRSRMKPSIINHFFLTVVSSSFVLFFLLLLRHSP